MNVITHGGVKMGATSFMSRGITYKVLCVVSPPPSIGITLSDWYGGEHHAKNPLDETAGDYMGIESRLQSGWG